MIVVALDTCFDACSVAVADLVADRLTLLASERQHMSTGHAEAIVPMLDRVMRAAGRRPTTVAHIVVTHGPGTFAGTRVGVAIARALGTATGATTASISSLHAIAEAALQKPGADADARVATAIDARRGQLYVQLVSRQDGPVMAPALLTPREAARLLTEASTPVRVVGSGATALVEAAGRADVTVDADADPLPDARTIVMMTTRLPGGSVTVAPLYLRDADVTLPAGPGAGAPS